MKHHGWIVAKFNSDADLTALRDFHTMPDLKPRKSMTQKNEERQQLRDDELAYITAGGCVDYRDINGEQVVEKAKPEKKNDSH